VKANRGLIREGMFADVTIFDPAKVIDRATFESPNQYPVGIECVLVNGTISVDKGSAQGHSRVVPSAAAATIRKIRG